MPTRKRYGFRFLTIEHTKFLLDPDTLHQWIGRSLKERCLLFHRHFGNHRINSTLLSLFYKKHKIKCKKIKFVKPINPDKEHEYEQWRLDLKEILLILNRSTTVSSTSMSLSLQLKLFAGKNILPIINHSVYHSQWLTSLCSPWYLQFLKRKASSTMMCSRNQ